MSVGAILTVGLGSYSDVNHLVTLGYDISSAPPPPIPVPATGSGGVSRVFGYYPRADKELKPLKRKIEAKTKKLRKVERQLSFALSQDDLQKLLAQLNVIQEELTKMTEQYSEAVKRAYEKKKMIEDEEVLMLII